MTTENKPTEDEVAAFTERYIKLFLMDPVDEKMTWAEIHTSLKNEFGEHIPWDAARQVVSMFIEDNKLTYPGVINPLVEEFIPATPFISKRRAIATMFAAEYLMEAIEQCRDDPDGTWDSAIEDIVSPAEYDLCCALRHQE